MFCLLKNLRNMCRSKRHCAIIDRVGILAGHVLQVTENGFRKFRLQHGHDRFRAGKRHKASTAAERSPSAKHCGPRHISRTRNNHGATLLAFVTPFVPFRQQLGYQGFCRQVNFFVEFADKGIRVSKRSDNGPTKKHPPFANVRVKPGESEQHRFHGVDTGFSAHMLA